jgi:hypothetical protein
MERLRAFLRRWWSFFTAPLGFLVGMFLPMWAVFLVAAVGGTVAVVWALRLARGIKRAQRRLEALQAASDAGAPMEVMERIATDPQYGKPLRAYREEQA